MEALQFDLESKSLSLVNIPVPTVSESGVLIKVAYAGICGTDLHIIEGALPCGNKVILGHELSGTIEAVGRNVKHLKPGDEVAVDPNSGCGACHHCRDGNYHYCEEEFIPIGIFRNGGWAKYCSTPDNQVFKLPTNISLQEGNLQENMTMK